jgi:hypothetical protein
MRCTEKDEETLRREVCWNKIYKIYKIFKINKMRSIRLKIRVNPWLDWFDGFGEGRGILRVENFFARDPTAPGHRHAVLHIVHGLH